MFLKVRFLSQLLGYAIAGLQCKGDKIRQCGVVRNRECARRAHEIAMFCLALLNRILIIKENKPRLKATTVDMSWKQFQQASPSIWRMSYIMDLCSSSNIDMKAG